MNVLFLLNTHQNAFGARTSWGLSRYVTLLEHSSSTNTSTLTWRYFWARRDVIFNNLLSVNLLLISWRACQWSTSYRSGIEHVGLKHLCPPLYSILHLWDPRLRREYSMAYFMTVCQQRLISTSWWNKRSQKLRSCTLATCWTSGDGVSSKAHSPAKPTTRIGGNWGRCYINVLVFLHPTAAV